MPQVSPTETREGTAPGARQRWMRVLALAETDALEHAWQHFEPKPEVQPVRGPEAGLVMVRARADATGAKFNLGEATVARATVRLHGGPLAADVVGSSYVLGTDLDHALLAAIFDGLLLDEGLGERVLAEVVEPLAHSQGELDAAGNAEARSTRVEFFTVAREHE